MIPSVFSSLFPILGIRWAKPPTSHLQESKSLGWVRKGEKCVRPFGGRESTHWWCPAVFQQLPHSYCASWDGEYLLQPLSPGQNICPSMWYFPKLSHCQHPASSSQDLHTTLCIEKEMTSGNNSIGIWDSHYLRIRGFFRWLLSYIYNLTSIFSTAMNQCHTLFSSIALRMHQLG